MSTQLKPWTIHFQILVVGTIVVLVAGHTLLEKSNSEPPKKPEDPP